MEFGTKFFLSTMAVYIITCVITSSSIFSPLRIYVMNNSPFLQLNGHKHFIECRLCVGFWVSLAAGLLLNDLLIILPLYGASYFLATQER